MARNRLPEPSPTARTPGGPDSAWARLGAALGWLSSRETLPESAAPPANRGEGFLRWLAAREVLPETPTTPLEDSPLRWLTAREKLPDASNSSPHPDSPGFLRWLFGAERPADPPTERSDLRP